MVQGRFKAKKKNSLPCNVYKKKKKKKKKNTH